MTDINAASLRAKHLLRVASVVAVFALSHNSAAADAVRTENALMARHRVDVEKWCPEPFQQLQNVDQMNPYTLRPDLRDQLQSVRSGIANDASAGFAKCARKHSNPQEQAQIIVMRASALESAHAYSADAERSFYGRRLARLVKELLKNKFVSAEDKRYLQSVLDELE